MIKMAMKKINLLSKSSKKKKTKLLKMMMTNLMKSKSSLKEMKHLPINEERTKTFGHAKT